MARMGHDSERAALIYQHRARGAYKISIKFGEAHTTRAAASGAGAGVTVPSALPRSR
jgi:hypothetical protein